MNFENRADRDKFLERNRIAADRCRKKKREDEKRIDKNLEILMKKNLEFQYIVEKLKMEQVLLKTQLLQHKPCQCNLLDEYLGISGIFQKVHSSF